MNGWWQRTAWLVCGLLAPTGMQAEEPIRFGRDVLPILSANCFACHGPDASVRKAELRLDVEENAKAPHDNGTPVVPKDWKASTVWQRITSADPFEIMPPPDSHKTLKPEQKELLRRWIAEGAVWGKHWSLEAIARPQPPRQAGESSLDALTQKTLSAHGLTLRPQTPPHQLVRRVALDLIGLPPSVELADRFAADPSAAAWEKLVDDLLSRPEFGEHWARLWMDLARYADTKGYEKDLGRTMWPYRDWLIRAINDDLPLDQMTVEQLAGDLLPNPTLDQLIATAFHRQTMSNDEGGTDDEEFRTIAVKDRVDTTLQVWMGLTAGCAKCHSHKYDPLSQSEYYSLYAIFNQTQDADRYDDAPTLEVVSPAVDKQRQTMTARLTELRLQLAESKKKDLEQDSRRWQVPKLNDAKSAQGATLKGQADGAILASGPAPAEDVYTVSLELKPGKYTVLRLQALAEAGDQPAGVGRNPRDPNFVLSELEAELQQDKEVRPLKLSAPRADFAQDGWPVTAALDGQLKTGWAVSPRQKEDHVAVFELAEPVELQTAAVLQLTMRQHYGESLTFRRFRWSVRGDEPKAVQLDEQSEQTKQLTDAVNAASKELQELTAKLPKIPVMRPVELGKERTTKIHRRGNFLDPGDMVTASLPEAFAYAVEGQEAPTRLTVARWLMNAENPLTSRVWANRIWARLFGVGIVETEEDFGALGAMPSQPELLDWLASEYRDGGWSLKKFLKTIVMSRTYQQASDVSAELRETDPRNVLLSRGARYRLSAEAIRDQSLASAGLLSSKMGGPPVMPPQPDGLWRSTYNGQKWVNAEGEDRFRRAIYTYLKRTTPYPSMTTFDGGSGEVCQIRRIRTNTPLQALVTLNDPVYLEAAGALAGKMVQHEGDRFAFGLRRALIRPVRPGETKPLESLQRDLQAAFAQDPDEAKALVRATRMEVPVGLSEAEFASWVVAANAILNLDEFLTRN